jgi:phosphatidate cytidylyltransferase
MAFNVSVFKTRAITALIFVGVMAAGLLIHPYLFLLLISVIHFGAWWEYYNLIDKINNTKTNTLIKIGMMVTSYTFLLWATSHTFLLENLQLRNNFSVFFAAIGFLLTVIGVFKSKSIEYKTFFSPSIAIVYITLSCVALINLSSNQFYKTAATQWLPQGILLPLFVIACMWINDTMAYLVGSFIGKTPLSSISPKKTWEGTIGGIILCAVVVGWAMHYFSKSYFDVSLLTWMLWAGIAAILGTIGDLVESKIKRSANVKDSGKFMPGHGGFLDRFDSLLFATSFMWLIFHLFLKP